MSLDKMAYAKIFVGNARKTTKDLLGTYSSTGTECVLVTNLRLPDGQIVPGVSIWQAGVTNPLTSSVASQT